MSKGTLIYTVKQKYDKKESINFANYRLYYFDFLKCFFIQTIYAKKAEDAIHNKNYHEE